MTEKHDPWPLWAESATKGDLISAIVHLRATLTTLAGAIVSIRSNDQAGVMERIDAYFQESKQLEAVMNKIGGETVDGE